LNYLFRDIEFPFLLLGTKSKAYTLKIYSVFDFIKLDFPIPGLAKIFSSNFRMNGQSQNKLHDLGDSKCAEKVKF
jgi:hypothetical protein